MLKVMVQFDDQIPSEAQGSALLAFERHLRELTGLDCRVLKARKDDELAHRKLVMAER